MSAQTAPLGPNQTIYGLDCTPASLIDKLEILARLPVPETMIVWGAMGIGKSQIAEQLAARLEMPFVIWNLSTWATEDANGIPFPRMSETKGHEVTTWVPPDIIPTVPTVIILEEMNGCAQELMVTMYHLLLERRLGVVPLPEGSVLIALANRDQDRGATNPLPKPLSDRAFHFHLQPSADDWCDWAVENGIPAQDIAFVKFRGDAVLHNMPQDGHAFPTPRSWTKVFKACMMSVYPLNSADRLALATAKVGYAAALEYSAFRDQVDQLVPIEAIIKAPAKAPVPERPDMQYAMSMMLASRTDRSNIAAIHEYVKRIGADYVTMWAHFLVKRDPDMRNTTQYVDWATHAVAAKEAIRRVRR